MLKPLFLLSDAACTKKRYFTFFFPPPSVATFPEQHKLSCQKSACLHSDIHSGGLLMLLGLEKMAFSFQMPLPGFIKSQSSCLSET